MLRLRSCSWLLPCAALLGACAAHAVPERAPSALPDTAASINQPPASAAPASSPQQEPSTTANVPAEPPPLALKFERVLTQPVRSLALGDGGRIAVLAAEPFVNGGKGFRELALPAALKPKSDQTDEVAIFFGRDYEPRIMGTRQSSDGDRPIYLRHVNGTWRDGREEIGQLGSANRGDLWGELGTIDPELVCRTNAVCIIKRNSGWVTAPAGNMRRSVQLVSGNVLGLDASGISSIDAKGWKTVTAAPAWQTPRAFWTSNNDAWVACDDGLWHFTSGAWSKSAIPITQPRALWGLSASAVWLVGQGGAARFDGKAWQRVALAGPLGLVAGRAENDVWIGGDSGLFRLVP